MDRAAWEQRWLDYLRNNQETILALVNRQAAYEDGVRIPGLYASAFAVVNNAYNRDEIFTYLDDAKVPNTSNAIESLNSTLRELTRRHRGLNLEQRKNLVAWALACRQGQTRTQIKQQIHPNQPQKRHTF